MSREAPPASSRHSLSGSSVVHRRKNSAISLRSTTPSHAWFPCERIDTSALPIANNAQRRTYGCTDARFTHAICTKHTQRMRPYQCYLRCSPRLESERHAVCGALCVTASDGSIAHLRRRHAAAVLYLKQCGGHLVREGCDTHALDKERQRGDQPATLQRLRFHCR